MQTIPENAFHKFANSRNLNFSVMVKINCCVIEHIARISWYLKTLIYFVPTWYFVPVSWCKPVRNKSQQNSVGKEIKSSPTSINARQMSVTNNRTFNRFAINYTPMALNCKEMLKSVLMLSKFPRMIKLNERSFHASRSFRCNSILSKRNKHHYWNQKIYVQEESKWIQCNVKLGKTICRRHLRFINFIVASFHRSCRENKCLINSYNLKIVFSNLIHYNWSSFKVTSH